MTFNLGEPDVHIKMAKYYLSWGWGMDRNGYWLISQNPNRTNWFVEVLNAI